MRNPAARSRVSDGCQTAPRARQQVSDLLLHQQTGEFVERLGHLQHFFGRNLADDLVGVGVDDLHDSAVGILVDRELQALGEWANDLLHLFPGLAGP